MTTFNVQAKYQGGYTRKRTSTKFIVVHHAAAHYKQQTGIEDVEAIRRWHMEQHHNWPGIGYHIVLAEEVNGGAIARYNVSDLDLQRAHILNRNHECVGVCCATDFGNTIPTDKWVVALAEVLRDLLTRYPNAEIVGHKEIAVAGGQTRCPGDRWFEWKARLIRLATEVDYRAEWGDAAPFIAQYAIPQAFIRAHKLGKSWGRVLAPEFTYMGVTYQPFEHVVAAWTASGGVRAYRREQ